VVPHLLAASFQVISFVDTRTFMNAALERDLFSRLEVEGEDGSVGGVTAVGAMGSNRPVPK